MSKCWLFLDQNEQKRAKSTCSLVGCHGNQTKDISSISTYLKFTYNLIECKTLGTWGKGFRN